MEVSELKKGDIIKSGAYCTFFSEFVEDDCWERCMAGCCRYRQVMIDEVIGTKQGWERNGYKDGKWKDCKSYRYKAQTVITDVTNYD